MKILHRGIALLSIILIVFIAACQPVNARGLFTPKVTLTPFQPASATPTITPTATPTETPTPEATATPAATPTPSMLTIAAGAIKVPILLYHHVTSEISYSRYNIDPAVFETQMQWLFDNHYQTINVTQLADLIRNGGQIPQRPVVITFDDGNIDVFKNAYPILKKYGFFATFYVVDGYINGKDMVSSDNLKDLIKNGWEIGSHSEHHSTLTNDNVDLETEIRFSKLNMEKRLGTQINSFAYPFGMTNENVVNKTYNSGYTSAVGLGESITQSNSTIYYLSRIEIQFDYSMDKFAKLLPWSGPLQ
jgi:peptidoglycan/xylan/chitin deacetylase (PgdA/CDA1 family)